MEEIILAPSRHSVIWNELSESHQEYIDSLWQDILSMPRAFREAYLRDNATEINDGGRGIYSRDEALELATRLGISL